MPKSHPLQPRALFLAQGCSLNLQFSTPTGNKINNTQTRVVYYTAPRRVTCCAIRQGTMESSCTFAKHCLNDSTHDHHKSCTLQDLFRTAASFRPC
jgi:hypothetical protein